MNILEGGKSMKNYVVPMLSYVNLRSEECIATVSTCTGCCTEAEAATYNATNPAIPLVALSVSSV